MKLRKGLRAELNEIFDDAHVMVGSGDPDYFEEGRDGIEKLRKEVFALLKRAIDPTDEVLAEHRLFFECYLDKPEDLMFHAYDASWWYRRDKKDGAARNGTLMRASPPPHVVKMEREIEKLKAQVARLKGRK